jgi:hypothetical protein
MVIVLEYIYNEAHKAVGKLLFASHCIMQFRITVESCSSHLKCFPKAI